MCLLILLRGVDPEYPLIVASNRDEQRSRPSAPPGLFVGQNKRMLSPRDRQAHGTWMGVNEDGMFAGLTNLEGGVGVGAPEVETTRGDLPHLALDQVDVGAAVGAVSERVESEDFRSFQLLIADGARAWIVAQSGRLSCVDEVPDPILVLSNEHGVGELRIPGVEDAALPGLRIEDRFDALAPLLLDEGARSGHRILKTGGDYGTVSSSLLAIPGQPAQGLLWRYAAGCPADVSYKEYGNLGRRLRG